MSHHHSKLLHIANSLPCFHTIHPHRMWHHGNLLHKHLNHFSSLLFQPPAPTSQAAHQQQGQPLFIQPRVGPQGQHIRQQRYSSPFMQNFNPSAQPFIPAVEAQQNSVPNTQEPRVPKSADGKGVKSSSSTDKVCF